MSDSNGLPVLLPDDIERQGVIPVDDRTGLEELQSTQYINDPVGFRATSPPLASLDGKYCSVVQPGRQVLDSELLPELPGTLITGERLVSGLYYFVSIGLLRYPDGSETKVAIKHFRYTDWEDERFEMRIRREAVILEAVDHPNILRFIGYQMVEGTAWLVTPLCKDGSLTRYITNNPSMNRAEKLDLLCGAARGLMHLHSLKPPIVHGNIKPENVVIQDNLQSALSDSGLLRIIFDRGILSGLTGTGNRVGGTAGYQAKELLEGDNPTPGVDVYAFGGLILAAMSGRDPFWNRKNDAKKIVAICMDEIPVPVEHPGLPEDDPLWSLLRKCWSADPTNRPTMAIVLQQLEKELLTEV